MMSRKSFQYSKCTKGLTNRQSLSCHKTSSATFSRHKRLSDDRTETISKNPRKEALSNGIIDDATVMMLDNWSNKVI